MKSKTASILLTCYIVCLCLFAGGDASAKTLHVSAEALGGGDGSASNPFRRVQDGADAAQPGDIVLIHGGVYRETVVPPRGGTSEDKRIIYRAAPGEEAMIKGSERIAEWSFVRYGVWKAEIPNAFFGDYNPYARTVSGGWLNYGVWHHLGAVFLNGKQYVEKESAGALEGSAEGWYCEVDDEKTTILASFGKESPNHQLAEINVRENLFFPNISGLKYISLDGLRFRHSAANWSPPSMELQPGAIGVRMGKHWIIENCVIEDIRCAAISLGNAPGIDWDDIEAFGDHIVRNNIIRRCGQVGIVGQRGSCRSLIEGNLIEEMNYLREFGGWETAAIKFHGGVDVTIKGNLIRGVSRVSQSGHGIWIDFGNQGFRITGNIIYNTETEGLFMEMNHGPTLIDNNIFIGCGYKSDSTNDIMVHNLFVDSAHNYRTSADRHAQYYEPHSRRFVARAPGIPANERWFNNIFIGKGLEAVEERTGYEANYNLYLGGAGPSRFEGGGSRVDVLDAQFFKIDTPFGVSVSFLMNESPSGIDAPVIDTDLVGVLPIVGQKLEDRYGNPITVDSDYNGATFEKPMVGPLSSIKPGINTITWYLVRKSN